jgi:carbamoyl-phosphate synthase large subunit
VNKTAKKVIVLGSGPYSIGSSVEFDWCSINTVRSFAEEGYETVMINSNPETVSTDFDNCNKLYFDELSLERVLDIIEIEQPDEVVVFSGGQIPNNLAGKLANAGVKLFGTDPDNIDRAENRHRFSKLLDELEVDQPRWNAFASKDEAKKFADQVGYPVLIRPSKVLSGAAMSVAKNEEEMLIFLAKAAKIDSDAPVVISKFEVGAREIEMDAVAANGEIIIWAISEHVENAGVHSGDATMVLPPQKTWLETIRRIKKITKKLAKALEITGPFNIQFLAKNNDIKVIELNLRASRSFPFVSKVTGHNFIEIATKSALGNIEPLDKRRRKYQTLDLDHVGVKVPQFSFSRLHGADPVLSVEMASTGEVACFGEDFEEAFLKAMISAGFKIPQKNILLSIGKLKDKVDFEESAKTLQDLGYNLYGTEGTASVLREKGITIETLNKVSSGKKPNILDYLASKKLDLVINTPKSFAHEEITDGFKIRRSAVDCNIPLINNLQVAVALTKAIEKYGNQDLKIKSWQEFLGYLA